MESKTKATMWKSIKTVPETGVKSDLAFCLGSLHEKTNSVICKVQFLFCNLFVQPTLIGAALLIYYGRLRKNPTQPLQPPQPRHTLFHIKSFTLAYVMRMSQFSTHDLFGEFRMLLHFFGRKRGRVSCLAWDQPVFTRLTFLTGNKRENPYDSSPKLVSEPPIGHVWSLLYFRNENLTSNCIQYLRILEKPYYCLLKINTFKIEGCDVKPNLKLMPP